MVIDLVGASSIASMGPRSRDRGIANISQANNVAIHASMGPRSRDRGINCLSRLKTHAS